MKNKYPVYIVSKNRWEQRITMRACEEIGLPYLVVAERDQVDRYATACGIERVIELPTQYIDRYDTCDNGGEERVGPGAARNFCWDHSISNGHKRHWVLDDNCQHFYRLNRNAKVRVTSPTIFRCMEDFCDRYSNLAIAGMNYHGLCKQRDKVPPLVWNTRIYSFLLIENAIPYRWRGRYNEDTDLSLRVLKDGYCTAQFNAFLAEKIFTQRVKGGNTEEFYAHEGTLPKSQMIADLHPDVATVVHRFGRWHHHVDYRRFKCNQPRYRDGYTVPSGIDNYGMKLVRIADD
jgi:hypothetical protein